MCHRLRIERAPRPDPAALADHVTNFREETPMNAKLAAAAACACLASGTASGATPPCAAEAHRAFDFWVGEWDVRDADGKAAGVNQVTSEENGCVIVEHWRSAQGGHGQSWNYYDPATKKWNQLWIGLGLLLHMEGDAGEGSMRLQGPLQYLAQDKATTLRGTWTALPDGRVRQLFEESEDGGKTWTLWFDGYYARR
jgi:hypothetical protein